MVAGGSVPSTRSHWHRGHHKVRCEIKGNLLRPNNFFLNKKPAPICCQDIHDLCATDQCLLEHQNIFCHWGPNLHYSYDNLKQHFFFCLQENDMNLTIFLNLLLKYCQLRAFRTPKSGPTKKLGFQRYDSSEIKWECIYVFIFTSPSVAFRVFLLCVSYFIAQLKNHQLWSAYNLRV